MFGDGATIKKMPLINLLYAGIHEPAAVLDIVNSHKILAEGRKKDAPYIADLFDRYIQKYNPHVMWRMIYNKENRNTTLSKSTNHAVRNGKSNKTNACFSLL